MSVEIVQRMTARLKHTSQQAAKLSERIAEVNQRILPQMENDVRNVANAVSGQEKAIEIAEQAIAELKTLTEMVNTSNATIGAGLYHLMEEFDIDALANELSANTEDIAQIMNMFTLWFQANPKIIQDALELATGFTRQNALAHMEIDKLAEWQQDINAAIERKGDSE